MKIASIYFDVTMSRGHKGLREIHRKNLTEDECAIFINKRWTALKMLTPQNVILHLKQPQNRPIVPDAIKFLPHCVSGGELDYSKALSASINNRFEKLKSR